MKQCKVKEYITVLRMKCILITERYVKITALQFNCNNYYFISSSNDNTTCTININIITITIRNNNLIN